MKKKFKDFVEKHKVGIAVVTTGAAAVAGMAIGIKIGNNETFTFIKKEDWFGYLMATFKDAAIRHPDNMTMWIGHTDVDDAAISISELGKLGELMLANGETNGNQTYTHFLAIGPTIE